MLRLLSALALTLATTIVSAGEYNQVLSIGDQAPVWRNLPGVDGKKHSLADLKDKPIVVVVFTCNSCPVAVDYEDRIIAFAKRHADRVGVVALNVSQAEADSLDKMRERAELKKYPYPYVLDETQQIGRAYGAGGTPEFFVLSPERKIVYMGAMDDNADAAKATTNYLEPAVKAALSSAKPAIEETYAHGCRIRFARQRRQ